MLYSKHSKIGWCYMGITNSKKTIDGTWQIGDFVDAGWIKGLMVISGPHKNEDGWSPDYYIVVYPKNGKKYDFIPYKGIHTRYD